MASQPQPPRPSLTVPRPFLVLSPSGKPTVLSALTTRPLSLVGSTQPLLVVPLLSPLRFAHQAPLLQQVLHLLQLLLVLLTPLLSTARPSLVLCTRLPSRVPRPSTPLCAQRRPQLHLLLLLPVQLQLHLLLLPLVQVQLHLLLLPLVQVQSSPKSPIHCCWREHRPSSICGSSLLCSCSFFCTSCFHLRGWCCCPGHQLLLVDLIGRFRFLLNKRRNLYITRTF